MKLRNIFCSAASAAFIFVAGAANSASFLPVLAFGIDGEYEITTTTDDMTGATTSTFDVLGTFDASLGVPPPPGPTEFVAEIDFSLNDTVFPTLSIPFLEESELILGLGVLLIEELVESAFTPIVEGPATLVYGGLLDDDPGPFDVSGTYFIDIDTLIPIALLVDSLLADLDPLNELDLLGTFPANDSGDFSLDVTLLAAVPLPATLPLLLVGFGGLVAFRRRKTT